MTDRSSCLPTYSGLYPFSIPVMPDRGRGGLHRNSHGVKDDLLKVLDGNSEMVNDILT